MLDTVNETDFKSAMKNLAAGVTLITSGDDEERGGMTATAVCSLSASPAQLVVCVNRQNATHQIILDNEKFCVNVLAEDQSDIAQRFSSALSRTEKFEQGKWSTLKTGSPVLMDSLVSFDCELAESFQSATHSILVGRVVGVRCIKENTPLLYFRSGYAGISVRA